MLNVDEAISTRRSVRAFRSDPVSRSTVEHILEMAGRAPSGTNTQPWKAHVFSGAALRRLCDVTVRAFWNESEKHSSDRNHYLEQWRDPYLSRRRKVGWDLYETMGIKKGDRERARDFHSKNFEFFGAPVGMIFTIDRDMGWMSWLDYGMFLQNICIAARGQNLHTCPQASWGNYHAVVEKELDLPEHELVHVGMCLGYEDVDAPQNSLVTAREPLKEFVTFYET